MPKSTHKQGYTIVEVMVFLAVSGFMFFIAAGFISGKQSKAQFREGVSDLSSNIQRSINDVGNGYYPDSAISNFICTVDDVGNPPTFSSGGGMKQGDHLGCVFMGKVLHFTLNSSNYKSYAVAGRQYKTSAVNGVLPSTYSEAKPTAITTGINLTENKTIKWDLKVIKLTNKPPLGAPINLDGFGFMSSLSSYDTGNSLQSGSQDVNVVTFAGAGGAADLNSSISNLNEAVNIQTNPNILICLSNGSQFATITIGGPRGQRLSTTTQIYDTLPTGC